MVYKRFLWFFIPWFILLIICWPPPLHAQEKGIIPGDINSDGRVTVADAVLTLRIAVGLLPPSSFQSASADVDQDGKVTIRDVILILRAVVLGTPLPPSNPIKIGVAPGDSSVSLSWDPVPGALSYNLYIASEPGVTKTNYTQKSDGQKVSNVLPPFTLRGLQNGKTYYLVVTAVNAVGESRESLEVSVTPQPLPPEPPQPLQEIDARLRNSISARLTEVAGQIGLQIDSLNFVVSLTNEALVVNAPNNDRKVVEKLLQEGVPIGILYVARRDSQGNTLSASDQVPPGWYKVTLARTTTGLVIRLTNIRGGQSAEFPTDTSVSGSERQSNAATLAGVGVGLDGSILLEFRIQLMRSPDDPGHSTVVRLTLPQPTSSQVISPDPAMEEIQRQALSEAQKLAKEMVHSYPPGTLKNPDPTPDETTLTLSSTDRLVLIGFPFKGSANLTEEQLRQGATYGMFQAYHKQPRRLKYQNLVFLALMEKNLPTASLLDEKGQLVWSDTLDAETATEKAPGMGLQSLVGEMVGVCFKLCFPKPFGPCWWICIKPKAKICISKFNDLNEDGVQNPGESSLFGWQFDLKDNQGNSIGSATTDQEKPACLIVPAPGTYTVTEGTQSGWLPTTPPSQTLLVNPWQTVQATFGNKQKKGEAKICIVKFNDANGNGKQDANEAEAILPGWAFTLQDSSGTILTKGTTQKETNCVTVPAPGTYTVTEIMQPGWTPTTPPSQTVTVQPGQIVNVVFSNKPSPPEEGCCQLGLKLYNSLPNTIKQIRILPTDPTAVIGMLNDEEPDWTLTLSGNQYILEPVTGFVPADPAEVLDLDFAIKIDPAKSPTVVKVQWLDANESLVKEEELTLECLPEDQVGDENLDYNWFSKRRTLKGSSDNVLFAGAEPEECESDVDEDERALSCGLNYTLKCDDNGQNILKLTANSVIGGTYSWQISDNSQSTSSSGEEISYNLTEGDHSITAELTTSYTDEQGKPQSETCSQDISVCIPTAQFKMGIPQVICQGGQVTGWKVTFTPNEPSQECSQNIQSFEWSFGDGANQSGSGSPGQIDHQYQNPGTYTVTLKVTDQWGCVHQKEQTLEILDQCKPKFRIEYELCVISGPSATVISVAVKFINESQKFCSTTFVWDFGDGTQLQDNSTEVWHTYSVTLGQIPKTYTVTLTMKDPQKCPNGESTPITFQLKPVRVEVKALACPDGETHFVATTASPSATVTWASSWLGLKCEGRKLLANQLNQKQFTCNLDNGNYKVSVTAEEEQQGGLVKARCTKETSFTVIKTCCDDFKVKDHRDRPVNNKVYRIKFKHKIKKTIFGKTRIKGKTKFKVKKTFLGIPYYKRIKADQISVNLTDNLLAGGAHPDDPTIVCLSCITPATVTGNDSRYNSSKAKWKDKVSLRGIHDGEELTSVHYVKHKAGWEFEVTVKKPAGNKCDSPTITETK